MSLEIFKILDDQQSVLFTGRVNILSSEGQLCGLVLMRSGDVVSCKYKGLEGLRALYGLCISELSRDSIRYVVEPEIISESQCNIHFPYSILKKKVFEVVNGYRKAAPLKPPSSLKLLINPSIIYEEQPVSLSEYAVLCTLSDYNRVDEIYENCHLAEYEVTMALVSLRKKNALKVVKKRGVAQ